MSHFEATDAELGGSIACTGPCCGPSRRGLLRGLAAVGAAAALPTPVFAQGAAPPRRRVVDIHHHYFPDAFKNSFNRVTGLPPFVRDWSPQRMLEEMDRNNIDKSVLSLAAVPNEWFKMDPRELRPLLRGINEFGARLVDDHKGRHGLFAFISGSDVDGSLAEIAYAFDTLKADGVEMATSFGDRWPGDPAFAPVFEELNRRKAIVYFHPLEPFCCGNLVANVPSNWIEYPYDSGRTIASLLSNGALAKYRDIRWIFSHSGGAIPYLAHRIDWQSRSMKNLAEIAPEGVLGELRRLHYETANAASGPTMAALLKFTSVSQVLYGSDFPYVTSAYNLTNLRGNDLGEAELAAIEHGNAERLIPRLKENG